MKRRAIDELLARYGIEQARVHTLNALDGTVHRITPQRLARGGGLPAGDLLLRIYPAYQQERAAVDDEIGWLLALQGAGQHVPRPLPDLAGGWVQAWHADASGPRHAVLFTWLGGRQHDRGLSPLRLRRIGVLTAHLHRTAQQRAEAGLIHSKRAAEVPDLAAWAEGRRPPSPHLPAPAQRLVERAAARLAAELAALPRDAAGFGFVHGDLHAWNIVFVHDLAGAIDFSECGWGHHARDFASTLQYLAHPLAGNHDHRAQYARLHDALLDGYAGIRVLPADVERQIGLFIVMRCIGTLEWLLDDWPAPDHRAWGPRFLAGCPRIFEEFADAQAGSARSSTALGALQPTIAPCAVSIASAAALNSGK